MEEILKAAETITAKQRKAFCTNSKARELVRIRDAIIFLAKENGIRTGELATIMGLDPSTISRREEAARVKTDRRQLKLLRRLRSVLQCREP